LRDDVEKDTKTSLRAESSRVYTILEPSPSKKPAINPLTQSIEAL